jgi:hypothetical protein
MRRCGIEEMWKCGDVNVSGRTQVLCAPLGSISTFPHLLIAHNEYVIITWNDRGASTLSGRMAYTSLPMLFTMNEACT